MTLELKLRSTGFNFQVKCICQNDWWKGSAAGYRPVLSRSYNIKQPGSKPTCSVSCNSEHCLSEGFFLFFFSLFFLLMANEGLKLTQTRLNQLNPRHFSLTFRARTPQTLPWTWRRWCLTTPWRPLSWWMWHPKTALGWWKPSRCCSRLHSQPLCCWAAPTERTDGSWHRTRAARRWDWDHNVISRAVNLKKKKKKNSNKHKTDFKSSHKFLSFYFGDLTLKERARP